MKLEASFEVAPFQGPATEMKTTFPLPYCAYRASKTEAIFWQCVHHGSMNSRSTTFPRNELRAAVCPVRPFEVTMGSVKSGAPLDCDREAVEEYET